MSELDRWHNILGGFDWHRIRTDFESLHKQAEDAGFELKINLQLAIWQASGLRRVIGYIVARLLLSDSCN